VFGLFGRVASTGKPEKLETFVTSFGDWFSISAYSPKKEHFVVLFDVITERKRAEEAASRLASIVESSDDAIFRMTLEGTIASWNRGAERLYGFKAAEAVGQSMAIIVPPEILSEQEEFLGRLAHGDRIEQRKTVGVRKDGGRVDISITLSPIHDGHGAVTGASGIARDITSCTRAEAALEESERKYRVLFTSAGEAIFIFQNGRVVFPNPKTMELTGYSMEELAGMSLVDLIHPEDWRQVRGRYRCREAGNDNFDHGVPFRIQRKTGEAIWVRGTAERVDWEGRPGLLCFFRDITKEKKLEAQFIRAQKMEAVGTLAGGIAHDFNNALMGIFGYTEVLKGSLTEDESALSDLNEITRCAERAALLTRQLLTYARRQIIEPVDLNLNSTITDLMAMVSRVLGEQIEIRTSLAKDLPAIRADVGQIEQLIMNLIVNARDAMPNGGQVVIETEPVQLDANSCRAHPHAKAGPYVLLSVSDNGPGMDAKTLEHAFEPFFTTKAQGEGSGLGLSMVYGIIQQHHGFVDLHSEPGNGTSIRIYLPAVEGGADRVIDRKSIAIRGGTETLLLAEDDESARTIGTGIEESGVHRIERTGRDRGGGALLQKRRSDRPGDS
jgi:PAS domain S-box-containing protein